MNLKVGDFYDAIDTFAPFASAESWDNVGILVGNRQQPVNRVLLALDLTGAVLEEAKRLKADLVITHHPILFQPVKQIDSHNLLGKTLAAGVAVISAHTNLDLAQGGVNDALAERLQLQGIRPFVQEQHTPYRKIVVYVPVTHALEVYEAMSEAGAGAQGNYAQCAFFSRGEGHFLPLEGAVPAIGMVGEPETVEEVRVEMLCTPPVLENVLQAMRNAHPYEEPSFDVLDNHALHYSLSLGRIGGLDMPMSASMLAKYVKERLGAEGVRYTSCSKPIQVVAVCGGSGGDLLAQAKAKGAQALVTGEVKHHQLLEAASLDLALIDAGHFSTENVVMEPLRLALSKRLPGAIISLSSSCTDGIKYIV